MHPAITAMVAAEHVKDMQAQAIRTRRVRRARRARRGGILVTAAPIAKLTAFRAPAAAQEPCLEPACQPVEAKAA